MPRVSRSRSNAFPGSSDVPIKGRVFIVPNAETRSYELWVKNEGDQDVGVTNNILPPNQPNLDRHDDHERYGHGLIARPGSESWQAFRVGDPYHGLPIAPGCHLRVGLRNAAYKTVELPPLDSDPIEIEFKDFVWYGQQGSHSTAGMAGYQIGGMNTNVAQGSLMTRIEEMRAKKIKYKCTGEASVTAVAGNGGALSHWEVKFTNSSAQAWIGTCVFDGAEKNDGMGLESMACPDKGSAAMQRIEAMGNYGKDAVAGAKLRLGVRGYGSFEVALPSSGAVKVDLKQFKIDAAKMADEFFDHGEVDKKRQEKMAKVQFFGSDGAALNAEMKPIVRKGQEAIDRTDFPPPHVKLRAVDDSAETPGGGWLLEVESRMPARDAHVGDTPEIGFVATVRLGDTAGDEGWDPQQIPPKRFETPNEAKSWFIPAGANVNGVEAKQGEVLIVGTRGLGWYTPLTLPAKGKPVDTDKNIDLWHFREDQFARRNLRREFTGKCRN